MSVYAEDNVSFLPKPNIVELLLTRELAPRRLTMTAFVLPVFDDGSILLAHHQRRGLECPGGHIEPGESYEEAARREAWEEAGCIVGDIIPIGFLRMNIYGDIPEGYRYPAPISYQQFFAGRIISQNEYEVNEECLQPVRVYPQDFPTLFRKSIPIFAQEAFECLKNS